MQRLVVAMYFMAAFLAVAAIASAQVVTDAEGDVGVGTIAPHPSALVDFHSTSKGFLMPVLTRAQRDGIQGPAPGLVIVNSTDSTIQINCGDEVRPIWCVILQTNTSGGISAPLSPGAIWYGGSDSLAVERQIGSENSVLVSDGAFPVWTQDLQLNSVEVDSLTVNEYANITNNVFTTDSAVFNTNVVFNDTALFNEYTNINGVEFHTDSTVNFWDQVTINVDSTVVNNTFVSNDTALFNGPVEFGDTVIFNTLPSLPLSEDAMYVGNGDNVAAELAGGNDGDILTINGTAPTWTANPGGLLPGGTVVNSTMRWDGTEWVENTNLRSDAAGNTIAEGDLSVNGTAVNLPAGSVDNVELANSSINVTYGTGVDGSASVSLGGTLNLQNTGVTSISGTPNQVGASASTGAVTLSTPQDIHTDATPTFDGLTLDNLSNASTATDIIVSNGGVLETRTAESLGGLVSVVTDATLQGDGTAGSPLGIDLANPNSWTGTQTFATVDVNGGTVDGTSIGSSVRSTGSFTTVDASAGISLSGAASPLTVDGDPGTANQIMISSGPGATPDWEDASTVLAQTAWLLGGNTAPGSNVFGTLDGTDIDVRTNNTTAITVDGTTQDVDLSSNLTVSGNGDVAGDVTVDGNTVLGDNAVADAVTVNAVITANGQGNTIGDNSANQQVTVDGLADAVVGNTLAGNPTVWDAVVDGDLVATGIVKTGGSLWIDGVTPNNHQIAANDNLNLGTISDDDLTLSTNSATAVRVDGTTQQVDVETALNLNGGTTPLLANGVTGAAGDALISAGAGVTPRWGKLDPSSLNLSENAMFVGDAADQASELPAVADRILTTDGSGVPGWRSSLPSGVTVGFDQITSGTNTMATMNVGTGASLQPTGTGSVTANRFVGTGSTSDAVDLATGEVNGVLPIANGGTNGTAVPTSGAVAYGTGSAYAFTGAGDAEDILVSNGAAAPSFEDPDRLFWKVTGNMGLNPGTHFLGTGDAQPLRIVTDSTERVRIHANGRIGVGNVATVPQASLHVGYISGQEVPRILAGSNYSVDGDINEKHFFSSEGWVSAPPIVGVVQSGLDPDLTSLGTFGSVGVVGSGNGGTGGRRNVGVYGHGHIGALLNGNPGNSGVGGVMLARITPSVTDFNGTLIGVRAQAYSDEGLSATSGTFPTPDGGFVYGVYSTAEGNPTDTTFGGYFSASGANTNFGIYSDAGTNYFADPVGVGTTEPSNPLHVSAASDPLRLEGLQTDNTLTNLMMADANGVVHLRSTASLDGSFWSLTGNSGTNSATNFLGTTDAQDLVFRTNDVERARFDEANGGHFVPGADDTYDLGSTTLRWRDLYLGPTSLHVTSTAGETGTARDWSLGIQEAAGASQGNLRIAEGGADLVNITPTGRIGIGETNPDAKLHVAGEGNTDATSSLHVVNSDGEDVLTVQDDMVMRIGDPTSPREARLELSKDNGGSFILRRTSDQVRMETSGSVNTIEIAVPRMYFTTGHSPQLASASPIRAANGVPVFWASESVAPSTVREPRIGLGEAASAADGVRIQIPVSPSDLWSGATGLNLVPTFSASANNQRLSAFVIEPAFNNGGFTGVSNLVMEVNRSNGNPLLTAVDDGNVGVGTLSPQNPLHVSAASDPLRLEGLQTDNALTNLLVADANGVVHQRSSASLEGTFWSLTGNSGTNPATNFLGTTDAQDLVFRTNDVERVRIDAAGDLNVTNNATVEGNVAVEGNTVLGDNAVADAVTVNAVVTANGQGNTIGDNSANQQVIVDGVADAVVGNTLAGNPAVWDQVIDGDLVATGIVKAGGSLWIDGVTPDNHQVVANDALNVGTTVAEDLTLSTDGTTAVSIDGTTQQVNVQGALNLEGANAPLLVNGISGLPTQVLFSNGLGSTPQWGSINENVIALSFNAMFVGDNGDGASELAAIPTRVLTTNAAGVPGWRSALPLDVDVSFAQLTSGNNTAATMNVGTGASLQPVGAGTVTANQFVGTGSTTNAVDLATGETSGVLPVAKGGTNGTATPSAGAVAYGTGSAYGFTGVGSSGDVLVSNGAAAPTFQNPNALFWGLGGNSILNPNAQFLGTTNSQPLVVRTNNSERLRVEPDGDVAIGTTTANTRLRVSGGNVGLDQGSRIIFDPDGAQASGYLRNQQSLVSVGAQDVELAARGGMHFLVDFNNTNSNGEDFVWGEGDISPGGANYQEHMRLTQTGHLGLGTSNPGGIITIVNDNESNVSDDFVMTTYSDTYTPLHRFSRARGTQAAPDPLNNNDVVGLISFQDATSATLGAQIRVIADANHTAAVQDTRLEFRTTSGTSHQPRMTIDSDGRIGVGTISPSNLVNLHVVGDAGKTVGGTTWVNLSDGRLKDIQSEYEKGLDEVLALRPVVYRYKAGNPWNAPSDVDQYGYIAQEVETVFPEAVMTGDDGYLVFNMHPILVAYTNAVKQLNANTEELREQNEELLQRLEALEAQLQDAE